MGAVLDTVGKLIAGYLQKEVPGYEPFTPSDPEHLRRVMQQGDDANTLASGDGRCHFGMEPRLRRRGGADDQRERGAG